MLAIPSAIRLATEETGRYQVQFSGFRVKHGMTTRGKLGGINLQQLKGSRSADYKKLCVITNTFPDMLSTKNFAPRSVKATYTPRLLPGLVPGLKWPTAWRGKMDMRCTGVPCWRGSVYTYADNHLEGTS